MAKNKAKKKTQPVKTTNETTTQPQEVPPTYQTTDPETIIGQAKVLSESAARDGKNDQVVEYISEALSLIGPQTIPNQTDAVCSLYITRALAHLRLKEFMAARGDCKLALALNPRRVRAHLFLAQAEACLDRPESFAKNLRTIGHLEGLEEIEDMIKSVKPFLLNTGKVNSDLPLITIEDDSNSNNPSPPSKPPPLIPIGDYTSMADIDEFGPSKLRNLFMFDAHGRWRKKNADLCREVGNEHFEQGDLAMALNCYTWALWSDSEDPQLWSNRALAFLCLNRFQECVTDCTASIERQPSIKAFYRRGRAYEAMNMYKEAMEDYSEAIKIDKLQPQCVEAVVRLKKSKSEGKW
ncbi:mitochondrial import receptor subunit TOM34-like [Planoprotostelium fungivorum]|uniref:Mitochondrial import receptor subunit TOM34-like n=1 Tax=Planoprotostelium fungivorum TaxID=1890364 RepID=A0A2P6NWI8_9EUKA|nr:mitochondrial import receptor subunit TOM34-like [Planoprotostelium fungivorum]